MSKIKTRGKEQIGFCSSCYKGVKIKCSLNDNFPFVYDCTRRVWRQRKNWKTEKAENETENIIDFYTISTC